MTDYEYDLAVLGSGPGGLGAALQCLARGGKVCLVEEKKIGGVCVNVGCMPTKAMLRAAKLCWEMKHAAQFGIRGGDPEVDGKAFMHRVNSITEDLARHADEAMTSRDGVTVVRGHARLAAPDRVVAQTEEGEKDVCARAVVIATGARPVRPDFLPWASPRIMSSDNACRAEDLPESVLILGGGPVGCEFATVYSELGIPTTVVEIHDRLLVRLDPVASDAVRGLLEERGARVVTGVEVKEAKLADGGVRVNVGEETVEVSHLLAAVGRVSNIEEIGLEDVGVRLTDGTIEVDEQCRTNVEGVYAVGDCAVKLKHTHIASRMGQVAAENIMGYELREDCSAVPLGIYTHPQVAVVGMSEEEARQECDSISTAEYSYEDDSTARIYGEQRGGVKLIVNDDTGDVLGALWIGPHAIDMIHQVVLGVRCRLHMTQLWNTIHAHPSLQEAVHDAAGDWVKARLDRLDLNKDLH